METPSAFISLQDELEDLIQAIARGERFTCFGINIKGAHKGEQCDNPISEASHSRLAILFQEIIELLNDSGNSVETKLEEASLLVMCVRRHRDQSSAKFNEWLGRIAPRDDELAHGGGGVSNSTLTITVCLI